jgi:T5SS/PEP-CTERM-associated repeat protein
VNAGANTNSATVSQTSTWSVSSFLFVGESGASNQLNISGGSIVSSGSTFDIGRNAAASGNSASITGAGSKMQPGGVFAIGRNGDSNSMTISAGGFVNSASTSDIGAGSDNNTVMVTGSGSQWTVGGELSVGNASTANGNLLQISNNGLVSVTPFSAFVGQSGAGNTLTIDTGGDMTVAASFLIGRFAGATGNTATITGSGSTLTQNGAGSTFAVGTSADNNSMTVSAGGTVTSAGGGFVGFSSSNNLATVTGSGSTWTSTGQLSIGDKRDLRGKSARRHQRWGSLYEFQPLRRAKWRQQRVDGHWRRAGQCLRQRDRRPLHRLRRQQRDRLRGGQRVERGVGQHLVHRILRGFRHDQRYQRRTLAFNNFNVAAGANRSITNNGGVYEFANAVPSITAGTAGDITLNNGTVAYKGVSGANINNASVNNIVRTGNNTFRLDNSTGSATASYTFAANTANYQKLELMKQRCVERHDADDRRRRRPDWQRQRERSDHGELDGLDLARPEHRYDLDHRQNSS